MLSIHKKVKKIWIHFPPQMFHQLSCNSPRTSSDNFRGEPIKVVKFVELIRNCYIAPLADHYCSRASKLFCREAEIAAAF